MRLIDGDVLYERTAEWEAQALHMVDVTMHDEDLTEWRKWSAILNERSAFKHDVADAPTIEPRKGRWIVTSKFEDCYYAKCNECKVTQVFYYNKPLTNFCPNCGADTRGEQDG